MQTTLQARAGKYFAMESIGEQVRKFRERQTPPWNTTDMARAVGGNVKRQHIEQLEANPTRVPRYVARLASVMGTSIEGLMGEGREPVPPPGFSPEALRLAKWFDKITDPQNRFLAYGAMTQAMAPYLPCSGPLPSRKQSAVDPVEKLRAKRQTQKAPR
jgi:hypothetical protein